MPLHSLLTSLIRYFLDSGWLKFIKYSKIFRVFLPSTTFSFLLFIYLFIYLFSFYDSNVAKHCFVAADIVNCLESVKLNTLLLFFQMKI